MCSKGLLSLLAFSCVVLTVFGDVTNWTKLKTKHHYRNLTGQRMTKVVDQHDMELLRRLLGRILVERIPDTPGIRTVREYIVNELRALGWTVELDEFDDDTPIGRKHFVNVIAAQNSTATRWLTLACHYDSKILPGKVFLAATDSAVPCAMMLHLAHKLTDKLAAKSLAKDYNDISLQLLFLDGEEAFDEWTDTDSLYGARHLAKFWSETPYDPDGNTAGATQLDRIDIFLLLDLIGARFPRFHNWFAKTSKHFQRIADTEQAVNRLQRELAKHGDNTVLMKPYPQNYFSRSLYHGDPYIKDDHIPFLVRHVPVIHMISAPFPPTWHTAADDESNLDFDTIQNLNAILRVYVTEYLHLSVGPIESG